MSLDIPSTGSVYADAVPKLIEDLRRAIANECAWQLPFDAYNLLPGERQGQLMIRSFDVNGDRPDLDEVRLGRMAKTVTFTWWEQIAFDATDRDEEAAVAQAEVYFLSEAIALEHHLGRISSYLDVPDWIEKLVIGAPIDPRRSTPLKDGGRTWVVDITTDLELSFFVNADAYGQHLPTLARGDGQALSGALFEGVSADNFSDYEEVEWGDIENIPQVLRDIAALPRISDRVFGIDGDGNVALLAQSAGGSAAKFSQSFTDADLSVADLLPVNHGLNSNPAGVLVLDNEGERVTPDNLEVLSLNSLALNFQSFRPLTGNWSVQIL